MLLSLVGYTPPFSHMRQQKGLCSRLFCLQIAFLQVAGAKPRHNSESVLQKPIV
jgi:hypothetical protein